MLRRIEQPLAHQLGQRSRAGVEHLEQARLALVDARRERVQRGHERGAIGQNYFICGPTHTLVEGMTMAATIAKVKPPIQVAPGMLKGMSRLIGVIEKIVPLPEAYTSEGLRVIAGVTYIGDNSKAKRELGFAPRALDDGWRATVLNEMTAIGQSS